VTRRFRSRAAAAAAIFAALSAAAPAAAQEVEVAPATPEFSLFAGGGHSVKVNRGETKTPLVMLEPEAAFRLGPRFQWLIEAHYAHYFDPDGWFAGFLPVGARYYFDRREHAFAFDFLAGLGWTNLRIDEIDRRFNFILEGGPAMRFRVAGDRAWWVSARWLHYSNAGSVKPNLGFNAVVLLGGYKF
jgi:hypothetical protein